MRKLAFVAVILAIGLGIATVEAQKGKPAPPPPPQPTWSVSLSGENINGPSEGLTASEAVVLDVKVWGIQDEHDRSVWPCHNCTVFYIQVRTPWSASTGGQFIEFSGVEMTTEYNYSNVTPNCRFPSFDANGVIQPAIPAGITTGCAPAFLSNKHPQFPYTRAMLEVKAAGDALSMAVGDTLESKGVLLTQVIGPDCYTTPPADKIYFNSGVNPNAPRPLRLDRERVKVIRTGEDQWIVDVVSATGVIDVTSTGPDPKWGRCGESFAFWSYTNPLATRMIWTRQRK